MVSQRKRRRWRFWIVDAIPSMQPATIIHHDNGASGEVSRGEVDCRQRLRVARRVCRGV